MPSDLTNIRDLNNANSAITIGSDGQITVNQNNPTLTLGTNATGFAGIKNAQEWRLQTTHTSTANTASMMNNWARTGPLIGSALTYSSASANDRFEFPETGIWDIDFQCNGQPGGTDGTYFQIFIYWCTDGSTFDKYALATAYFDDAEQTDGSQLYLRNHFLLDVTNTSLVYFRIVQSSNSGSATVFADGGANQLSATSITVKRIGDT